MKIIMQRLILIWSLSSVIGCATKPLKSQKLSPLTPSSNQNTPKSSVKFTQLNKPIKNIGGWYPVFLNDFDSAQLAVLEKAIKHGKISRITISFSKNQALAAKVFQELNQFSTIELRINYLNSAKSTGKYKVNENQVVLTVYAK